MKNPAEETTVRPNQNQIAGNRTNQSGLQLLSPEKEPQPSPHLNRFNAVATIQPNAETRSPFFANQFVNFATKKVAVRD